ncbi:MAG: hypothetical protein AMXMBFR64_43360 [Myxococcales bacterium]
MTQQAPLDTASETDRFQPVEVAPPSPRIVEAQTPPGDSGLEAPEGSVGMPITGARALVRLYAAVAVCALLAGATYLVPNLATYRPWIPGEPAPLAAVFSLDLEGASALVSPSIAAPAQQYASAAQARELVAADLGEAVAANLGEEAGVAYEDVPQPEEAQAEQAGNEIAVVGEAQGDVAGQETPPVAPMGAAHPKPRAVSVTPREIEGLAKELEDPSGRAMDAFYASLLDTAEHKEGALTRISHWGDSTIAADGITSTLRRRMQRRFGDGGHGFVLIARSYMPYRHSDIVHKENDGWKIYPVLNDGLRSGAYGFGGVAFQSHGGAWSSFGTVAKGTIGTAVSRFELFYQGHPGGGDLQWWVDDDPKEVLSTKAPETVDMWKVIEVPDGPHALSIRAAGRGQVRLYGMVLEREGPGVVYDSLGIVGARAARLLNADADHMAGQVRHRDPDLIVLAFGGNEAVDRRMSITWYEGKLAEVIRTMRAGKPEASCLIMAPLDQGERDERGNVRTIPIVPKIVEAQRRIAAQEGCAFFDTFEAMGGRGAMLRWFRSKPRLGWGDFVHATPAGYEVIGNMLYKALLKGFADYIERR